MAPAATAHASRRDGAPWRPATIAGAGVLTVAAVLAAFAHWKRSTRGASPSRVALIGDSYAVGLGPQLAQRIPGLRYEGHVGTSTQQWATGALACGQCGGWITAFQPDLTVVALGVNDGDGANFANYKTIADGLRGAGSRVLWVEPPAGVRTPTSLVRKAIAALGVPTVPATQTPVSSDGVHPQSYIGWAREIAESVRKA